jgi:ubiquinone/menaquinone biosynthesis C-methylase UbiE
MCIVLQSEQRERVKAVTFQLVGKGPQIYEEVMVPLWFGRWAEALIDLVSLQDAESVLDVACGTGVTTRLAKGVDDVTAPRRHRCAKVGLQ